MFQYMVLVLVAFELLQLLTDGRFSCGLWSIMVLFQLFVCVFSLVLYVAVVCFKCCVFSPLVFLCDGSAIHVRSQWLCICVSGDPSAMLC